MTVRAYPARRSVKSAVVIAAVGAASPIMNSTRTSGSAGSIGRYAAPVFNTASIATTASGQRSVSSATDSPGLTPCAISLCAS
ncbi:Uncharacterised protein [Mycobacteroides abscessus subsp. abscessus]|nr:Uncharacterised protein [Mycobacteroides abscessus subsp. abscessus]SKT95080.1 Uncharacterised protein [Mycobacteroides abscessus subsp. abscessus]